MPNPQTGKPAPPKANDPVVLRPATQTDAQFVWRATLFEAHEDTTCAGEVSKGAPGSAKASGAAAARATTEARRQYFLSRFDPKQFRIITHGAREAGVCRLQEKPGEILIDRIVMLPDLRARSAPLADEAAVIARIQEESRAGGRALRIKAPRDEPFQRMCESLGFCAEKMMSRRLLMLDHSTEDERWMREAITQAVRAGEEGESPIGAALVRDGRLLARGRNACMGTNDPTAHAEIRAIRASTAALKEQRLEGCELYVTVEPCAMCCGAALHARIARVIFGARNEKFGACGSQCNLLTMSAWNHRIAWRGGVLERECAAPLKHFFADRRS